MTVHPTGAFHVILKESGDHFIYTKPNTTVSGLILGEFTVDHHGTVVLSNA